MAMIVACPQCRARYKLPTSSAGKRGRCDRCKTVFRIPELPADSAVTNNSATAATNSPATGAGATAPSAAIAPPSNDQAAAVAASNNVAQAAAAVAEPNTIAAPGNVTPGQALWAFKNAMADAREAMQRGAYAKAGQHAQRARQTPGFETVAEARWFWLELSRHLARKRPVGLMDLGQVSTSGGEDKGPIAHLALSGDGASAAVVRNSGHGASLVIWDLGRDKALGPEQTFAAVHGLVACAAGGRFAVCVQQAAPEDGGEGGDGQAPEPDNAVLNNSVLIIDAATGETQAGYRTQGPHLPLWLDASAERLLTRPLAQSVDGGPQLWDLASREMLLVCEDRQVAGPALLTPDEAHLLCLCRKDMDGDEDATGPWRLMLRKALPHAESGILAEHAAEPVALGLSLDGGRAMSADQGGRVLVHELDGSAEPRVLELDALTAAWLTPCGGHVVAVDRDRMLFFHLGPGANDVKAGPRMALPSPAACAAMSLDGRFLLWAGQDGLLRLAGLDWDLDLEPRLWEDAVQSLCDLFFIRRSPRAARLDPKPASRKRAPLLVHEPRPPQAYPAREQIEGALTREGLPCWAEDDVAEFLAHLACAGLAAMSVEALAEHLDGLLQHRLGEEAQGFVPGPLNIASPGREPVQEAAPWLPDESTVSNVACADETPTLPGAEPGPAELPGPASPDMDPEATRPATPAPPDVDPEATQLAPAPASPPQATPVGPDAEETRLAQTAGQARDALDDESLAVITAEPASGAATGAAAAIPPSAAFAGLTPGEVFLERYEVLELLGEGGFGTVHRVHHLDWNLDLAVKSPRPEALAAAGGAENFRREAETWVNLGLHPHVASCFYVRDMDGVPRVFAEYVPGGSLKDWIRDRKLADAAQILDVAIQFAWGLAYAHAQGLVHQDVKPANVLMSADGAPKVTDFGLAVARTGTMTDAGTTGMGYTPAYAAPEQVEGKAVSQRADIWAFGLSLLEMFLGEVTWSVGTVAAEVLGSVLAGEQGDPAVALPPKVARLLAWCFKLAPELRPQSMAEVADALKDAYAEAKGEPYLRAEPRAARDSADSLNNRAVSLLDLGRRDDALALLAKAMTEQPHHPESTYNMNLLRWREGRVTDLEAVEALRVAAGSHEGDWAVNCLAAQVHLERGHAEAAAKALADIHAADLGRGEVRAVQEALDLANQGLGRASLLVRLPRGDAGLSVLHGHGRYLLAALRAGGRFVLLDAMRGEIAREFAGHPVLPTRPRQGKPLGRGGVSCLALSDDLQWAVSGGHDGSIRLWDTGSGRLLRVLPGHQGAVTCISLGRGGSMALTGGTDGAARLWDLTRGPALRAELFQHIGPVTAVQLGAESGLAFTAGEDGAIVQWDASTGRKLSLLADLERPVTSLLLSTDNASLATGDAGGGVALWEPVHGELLQQVEEPENPGPSRGVTGLSLSQDGRFLLVSDRESMRLRESPSGRLLRTFAPHGGEARQRRSGHVHSDGEWCSVFTCRGDEVRMADFPHHAAPMALARVRASEEVSLAQGEYEKWLEKARDASLRGDMAAVARCVREGRALQGFARHREAMSLWTGLYLRLPRKGLGGAWEAGASEPFPGPSNTLRLTPDGKHVLAAGEDEWRLWDAFTLEPVFSVPHSDAPRCLECAPDADLALSGGESTLALWETATGERLAVMEDDSFSGAACLGPGGRFALSGCRDGAVRVWDPYSGTLLATLRDSRAKGQAVTVLTASSDGRFAVSGDSFGQFRVWDLGASTCRRRFSNYHSRATAASISRDNRYLLAGVRQGHAALYRLATGRMLRTFAQPGGVEAACLGPGGRFAVTAGSAGLFLWDVGLREPLRVYEEGAGGVWDAALSPEGGHVVTRGADNRIRLWMLDWELEVRDSGAWDEAALPLLTSFCTRRTPYARQDPPGPEPRRADVEAFLSRKGRPVWSEEDFEELLRELGAAGFGWIDAEAVRNRLAELAESWQEPPRKLHPEEPGLEADPEGWSEHPGRWERFDMAMDRARALLLTGNDVESLGALAEARALPGFERNPEALTQWALFYKAFATQGLRRGFPAATGGLPAFPAPVNGLALHPASGTVLVGLGPGGPGSERLVAFNWSWGRRGPAWQVRRLKIAWTEPVAALDVNEQGVAILADATGRLVLWDAVRDAVLREFQSPVQDVREVRLDPQGRLCLVTGPKNVCLADAATGRVLRTTQAQAADPSCDWTRVLLARDRSVALWDPAADKDLVVMDRAGASRVVRMSLDGKWAVSGSDRGKVKLWDLDKGTCAATWDGHKGQVAALCLSPDGRTVVSGGRDGEIKAWDQELRQEITLDAWHQGPISALVFTPLRTHLISAGQDHMLRLWALDWEVAPQGRKDQDRVAAAMIEAFVRCRIPWAGDVPAGAEPAEPEIAAALTRQGTPAWGDKDVQELGDFMRRAGLGPQQEEDLRRGLESAVQALASATGSPTTSSTA